MSYCCNLLLMCAAAPALQQPCIGNLDDGRIRGICSWDKIGFGHEKTHCEFELLDFSDTSFCFFVNDG